MAIHANPQAYSSASAASASFGPLIADISLWFRAARHRGRDLLKRQLLAGAIWPLVIRPSRPSVGWRKHISLSACSA